MKIMDFTFYVYAYALDGLCFRLAFARRLSWTEGRICTFTYVFDGEHLGRWKPILAHHGR